MLRTAQRGNIKPHLKGSTQATSCADARVATGDVTVAASVMRRDECSPAEEDGGGGVVDAAVDASATAPAPGRGDSRRGPTRRRPVRSRRPVVGRRPSQRRARRRCESPPATLWPPHQLQAEATSAARAEAATSEMLVSLVVRTSPRRL